MGEAGTVASLRVELVQADKMAGAPAASTAAAAAAKKEEEAKEGDGKDSGKAQPKGGAWWQWLLVRLSIPFHAEIDWLYARSTLLK